MIPYIHLIRTGGLDAFLVYELEQSPMNMGEITSILQEMGCYELPQTIRVGNHYSDTVWVEYVYNASKGKYCQTNLEDEDAVAPPRKKK